MPVCQLFNDDLNADQAKAQKEPAWKNLPKPAEDPVEIRKKTD